MTGRVLVLSIVLIVGFVMRVVQATKNIQVPEDIDTEDQRPQLQNNNSGNIETEGEIMFIKYCGEQGLFSFPFSYA